MPREPTPAHPGPHEPAHGMAWRARCFHIIFGHHDWPGRLFDVILIIAIVASTLVTMLDSVQALHLRFGKAFFITE
jgi:voltage-gated potassium channel